MSEYQHYEFCSLKNPLSTEARKEMGALSSRANVGTHGASYVYNYGDFRGDPNKLLLKYFDVFFYTSNFGTLELMFKYPTKDVVIDELEKYHIDDVISCKKSGQYVVLAIRLDTEPGMDWKDGEGVLGDFLPLYNEIKAKNYQFLRLISAINDEFMGEKENPLKNFISTVKLSSAEKVFIDHLGI